MSSTRALISLVHFGPDKRAAAAVAAFQGDINARDVMTPLIAVLDKAAARPATLAALAARPDMNPYARHYHGQTALFYACLSKLHNLRALLRAFPNMDLDHAAGRCGDTALLLFIRFPRIVAVLLDAGASVSAETISAARAFKCEAIAELLERHASWSGTRSSWVRACVVPTL